MRYVGIKSEAEQHLAVVGQRDAAGRAPEQRAFEPSEPWSTSCPTSSVGLGRS
jgi:hypothetical protein